MSERTGPGHDAHVEEMLALFALDAVTSEDRRTVEAHLPECAACRDELALYCESAAQLLEERLVAPPPSLWNRIEEEIRTEPASLPANRWPVRWLVASAAAAIIAFAAGGALMLAFRDDGGDGNDNQFTGIATDDVVFTLAPLDTGHDATGRIFMNTARTEGVVAVAGLEPLPADQAYAVWIVRDDDIRVSAGSFTVDEEGGSVAALTMPSLPYEWADSGRYVALAISRIAVDEPDKPVGGAILVGPLY